MDLFASASEGSTVNQAGRDLIVNHPPPPVRQAWKVPPRNPNFTGRAEDLDRLATLLDQATVTVRAIRGMREQAGIYLQAMGRPENAHALFDRRCASWRAWWGPSTSCSRSG